MAVHSCVMLLLVPLMQMLMLLYAVMRMLHLLQQLLQCWLELRILQLLLLLLLSPGLLQLTFCFINFFSQLQFGLPLLLLLLLLMAMSRQPCTVLVAACWLAGSCLQHSC